jgi:hypothetical protein
MAAVPLPRVRLSIGLERISSKIYGEVNYFEQNYQGSIPGGGRIYSIKHINVNTCRQNYRASIPGGGNIYSIKRIVN